jgi:hypothetical protein
MKYLEGRPEERSGSAALFGNVLHAALEKWNLNRSQSLVSLTASAWLSETEGTSVNDFLGAYQSIVVQVMRAEKDACEAFLAKNKRETLAPRMTKHFKDSAACAKEKALLAQWLPRLNEESPWHFTERDPLPALYNESLIVAKRYAAKWHDRPAALVTEFGFDVKWHGFLLNGYIDSIEPYRPVGADPGIVIQDHKTYRQEAALMKDWRQMVMYRVAFRDLAERGVEPFASLDQKSLAVYCAADYVRLLTRKVWQVTKKDEERLLTELRMYEAGVAHGVFLPAQKNFNPDFCPYPSNCCMNTRGEGLLPLVAVEA